MNQQSQFSEKSESELLATLANLATARGPNYYAAIAAADELLRRDAWVKQNFADQMAAAAFLEDEYLSDLSGAMPIFDLLHIYTKFPNEADWKRHKYNLRKLKAEVDKQEKEQAKPKGEPTRRVTLKEFEQVMHQKEAVEDQFKWERKKRKDAEETIKTQSETIESLKQEVYALKGENKALREEVNELRAMVKGKLQKA